MKPTGDRGAAAERQRHYRARRNAGRVSLRIVVDEAALADALVSARFLRAELADDRKALAAAVERLLQSIVVADVERA